MDFSISVRPGAFEIIKNMSKLFDVIIFTASHSKYANPIIDFLDPHKLCCSKNWDIVSFEMLEYWGIQLTREPLVNIKPNKI